MTIDIVSLTIATLLGLHMAASIGANDLAKTSPMIANLI
jgi:phosphate/sulfate permease